MSSRICNKQVVVIVNNDLVFEISRPVRRRWARYLGDFAVGLGKFRETFSVNFRYGQGSSPERITSAGYVPSISGPVRKVSVAKPAAEWGLPVYESRVPSGRKESRSQQPPESSRYLMQKELALDDAILVYGTVSVGRQVNCPGYRLNDMKLPEVSASTSLSNLPLILH